MLSMQVFVLSLSCFGSFVLIGPGRSLWIQGHVLSPSEASG